MRHIITVSEIEAIGTIEHQLAASFGKGYSKRLKYHYDIHSNCAHWTVVLNNDDKNASAYNTLEEAIMAYNEL